MMLFCPTLLAVGDLHRFLYFPSALVDEQVRVQVGVASSVRVYPSCFCPVTHPTVDSLDESLCESHNQTSQVTRTNPLGHQIT